MLRFNKFSRKQTFVGLLLVILVLAPIHIRNRSHQLAEEARAIRSTEPAKALAKYQIAAFLLPLDQQINSELAEMYLEQRQLTNAIKAFKRLPLEKAGQQMGETQIKAGKPEQAFETAERLLRIRIEPHWLALKAKALMESDRGEEAVSTAKTAYEQLPNDSTIQIQLILAYGAAGKRAELAELKDRVGSGEPSETLQRARLSQTALAKELYARGLLRSSERLLMKLPMLSSDRQLVLAAIKLSRERPSKADYDEAKHLLKQGIELDPGNLQLHQMLRDVYLKLGENGNAAKESGLIKQLSG